MLPGSNILDSGSARALSFPAVCLVTSKPYLLDATSMAATRVMRLIAGLSNEPFSKVPSAESESDRAVVHHSAHDGSHVRMATRSASASHVPCADDEPT